MFELCTVPSFTRTVGSLSLNEHQAPPSLISARHPAPTGPAICMAAEPSAAPTVEEVRHTAEPEKSSVSSPQATTQSAIIVRNSHFHPFSQYLNIDIIGKL